MNCGDVNENRRTAIDDAEHRPESMIERTQRRLVSIVADAARLQAACRVSRASELLACVPEPVPQRRLLREQQREQEEDVGERAAERHDVSAYGASATALVTR